MGAMLHALVLALSLATTQSAVPAPERHDFVVRDFRFASGEVLPEIRLHYRTIGTPVRDARGRVVNGVLVLHGSSGDAGQVLAASFSEPLLTKGGPLDASKFFLIYPDNLGNGRSTKPSDGLRARFPKYDYTDMVTLQHRLVTEGLGIARLKLVIGLSMGGMQAWMWGSRYPDAMDAIVPIAAMPSAITGRNLLWRRILSHAIRCLGETITSYSAADAHLREVDEETLEEDDANNILYRFESSFDYNPEPDLERIRARVLTILFEDDELNPTTLGILERVMPRVARGQMVVIPAGPDTEGHRTQVRASVWRHHVQAFMGSLP
jgi:homoserine O-acetyltransferase